MGTKLETAPLEAGARVGAYVVQRLIAVERYGFSYLALDEAQSECLLREFLPQDFLERSANGVQPRDPDDRNPLSFWLRAYLERSTRIARFSHPALPRILTQFEAGGTGYEVSEYAPGDTLQALLDRNEVLDESRLLSLLDGVMAGLEAVHAAGLLHRDLCPQHIWLREADGSPQLQAFSVLRAPVRLKSGVVLGTAMAPFAAPEEDAPGTAPTAATDIYALGVIAYRALAGVLPPSPAARREGAVLVPLAEAARVPCSEAVAKAVDWALQLAPAQRPHSIADWRDVLAPTWNPAPLAVEPEAEIPAAAKRASSAAPRYAMAAVAVIAIAAGAYWLLARPPAKSLPAAPVAAAPSAKAAAGDESAAPAAATGDEQPSLDQLALDLIARERKLQEARDAQRAQEAQDRAAAVAKARETPRGKGNVAAAEGGAAAAPGSADTAKAGPAPAAVTPSPEAIEAEKRALELEREVARLRSEREARLQAAEAEAAKERAQAELDNDLKARKAVADREHKAQLVAQAIKDARRNCRLPAMQLSAGDNLTYYNALSAPGAYKTDSGAIRLPPVELSDGSREVYEITPDSCAHRVR